jgi:quinol monooxygenase YgiN
VTSRAILVELVVRQDDIGRARELIFENASATLENELACLRFDVLEEAPEPCRFTLYEVYRDPADFEKPSFREFQHGHARSLRFPICPAIRR